MFSLDIVVDICPSYPLQHVIELGLLEHVDTWIAMTVVYRSKSFEKNAGSPSEQYLDFISVNYLNSHFRNTYADISGYLPILVKA